MAGRISLKLPEAKEQMDDGSRGMEDGLADRPIDGYDKNI